MSERSACGGPVPQTAIGRILERRLTKARPSVTATRAQVIHPKPLDLDDLDGLSAAIYRLQFATGACWTTLREAPDTTARTQSCN